MKNALFSLRNSGYSPLKRAQLKWSMTRLANKSTLRINPGTVVLLFITDEKNRILGEYLLQLV
jgi:hypothetical protein